MTRTSGINPSSIISIAASADGLDHRVTEIGKHVGRARTHKFLIIFESATGTANQTNIRINALKQALFPVPPLAEQQGIVATVGTLTALRNALKARFADDGVLHR